ncbi:MAG: preprotein translocase subunit SecE [Bacilli bacterium]|nr:preprotein translocase subunit SecE [Bacilli bacterium]
MIEFLKNVAREMRKVTWPNRKELVNYTITVVVTVLFFAAFFFVVDLGISSILNLFFE